MKTMVKIFVDHEHLVRVINSLTELGITGFYLIEYQGMAPTNWKSFQLSEDPDMALKAIRDHSEPGVMVNTVVGPDKCQRLSLPYLRLFPDLIRSSACQMPNG